VLRDIEGILEQQVETSFGQDVKASGGPKEVAEILNQTGRSTEQSVLSDIEKRNPELATEIKNLMFVFEDLVLLDDRSIQRLLRDLDTKELSVALKSTSEEVKESVFRNMSERAAGMIKEELEFMGPVRLKDVEESQMNIVETIRSLEEEGEIVISGRGGEEEIVA
jgi:flagellar motor switch protein FliG